MTPQANPGRRRAPLVHVHDHDHAVRDARAHRAHRAPTGAGGTRARTATGTLVIAAAVVLVAAVPAAPAAAQTARGAPQDGKSAEWLVASALLAAPAALRDSAEVRGWTDDGDLVTLRPGTNGIICLADRPGDGRFAAACYHEGLEPFMERGRALRREGIDGMARNEARWAEIEAGTLAMPAAGMVYNLGFPTEDFDPATTDPATGGRLHALYLPGATSESTGLDTTPGDGPWLMFPGTPSAHIMIGLPVKAGG